MYYTGLIILFIYPFKYPVLYLVPAGPHFPARETEVLKGQVTYP